MLLEMQIHSADALRFVICLCLVGLITTAPAKSCAPEKCGDLEVRYPFWIKDPDCGASYWNYSITCKKDEETHGKFTPFVEGFGDYGDYYRVIEIDYEGHLIIDSSSIKAFSCNTSSSSPRKYFALSDDSPFTLSNSNRMVVRGCDTFGSYSYWNFDWNSSRNGKLGEARCVSLCDRSNKPSQNHPPYCPDGCCELSLPDNWYKINFTTGVLSDDRKMCASSFLMDPSTIRGEGKYGLFLNWGIGIQNCSEAKGTAYYSCSPHAQCKESPSGFGHVCKCLHGYRGNGYLNGTGCTDIDECSSPKLNKCFGAERGGICRNLAGFYNCSCAKGYVGDGFRNGTGCKPTSSKRLLFATIIGSVSSFVGFCLTASILVWWLKKRHLKLVETKYYNLLQQHIASTLGRESLRIFSAKEMARASNNYSSEMVLGSGGFGTVFKGTLLDSTLVAIKKSKQALNLEDDHEFLNEVAILSQINYRNIVKLLGCCIQTKFPLLVSEFIPNGTLFEHLHSKEGCLSWASRLQIAIETGEALAYLHSGASQPIYHRDVKSSNILLNERLSPKLADFGISRLISASNSTHVTTNIMGTTGYLDPEYFQTYQLTEKSDVYSFGVVLVELLTSQKPFSTERCSDEIVLSSLFLSRLRHNRLTEILDSKIFDQEILREMEDMAKIARECLHLQRRTRPSMKEVVEELIWIRGGTRKTKFCESTSNKCEDIIFEEWKISREASQTSREFRSYTFPSTVGRTSRGQFSEPFQIFTPSDSGKRDDMSTLTA